MEETFGKASINIENKSTSPIKPSDTKSEIVKPLDKSEYNVKFAMYFYEGEERRKVIGDFIIAKKGNNNWVNVFVPSEKKSWIIALKSIPGR